MIYIIAVWMYLNGIPMALTIITRDPGLGHLNKDRRATWIAALLWPIIPAVGLLVSIRKLWRQL